MTNDQPDWLDEAIRKANYFASQLTQTEHFEAYEHEDLSQDFAVKCLTAMSRYDPEKQAVSTFLGKVLRNHMMNMLKQRQKGFTLESLDDLDLHFEAEIVQSILARSEIPSEVVDETRIPALAKPT